MEDYMVMDSFNRCTTDYCNNINYAANTYFYNKGNIVDKGINLLRTDMSIDLINNDISADKVKLQDGTSVGEALKIIFERMKNIDYGGEKENIIHCGRLKRSDLKTLSRGGGITA